MLSKAVKPAGSLSRTVPLLLTHLYSMVSNPQRSTVALPALHVWLEEPMSCFTIQKTRHVATDSGPARDVNRITRALLERARRLSQEL